MYNMSSEIYPIVSNDRGCFPGYNTLGRPELPMPRNTIATEYSPPATAARYKGDYCIAF